MKLYVGNLPWKIDNAQLKEKFSKFGNVEDAVVITDKFSRRSKGFGFVTFASDEDAKKAMSEMNGKDLDGRPLTVNEARPSRNDRDAPAENSESKDAPLADPSEINDEVEEDIAESQAAPEVVDENSDAEGDEKDIETVEEAMDDAKDDEPATEDATEAVETTEKAEDSEEEE